MIENTKLSLSIWFLKIIHLDVKTKIVLYTV